MTKKYKLDKEDTTEILGKILYRIVALIDIGTYVKAGDKGGYIESENNLSQDGNAWVYNAAKVFDNAYICGDAYVGGYAKIYGTAEVSSNARVCGLAKVHGNAFVHGEAHIFGHADVFSNADYFCVQAFGSVGRTTTFFREHDGWCVSCGCFTGTIEEFRQKVKKTHGDSLIAQEYLMVADLMEFRIKRRNKEL